MTVGLGVERLVRARFEAAFETRATGVGGASLALTHDLAWCIGQVVLEARE